MSYTAREEAWAGIAPPPMYKAPHLGAVIPTLVQASCPFISKGLPSPAREGTQIQKVA